MYDDAIEDAEMETLGAPAPLVVMHFDDAPINTTVKFNKFALQSLKKVIFPHSCEFTYVATALCNIFDYINVNYCNPDTD